MADIFDVVADTTRRDILAVLLRQEDSTGECSVSEIVAELGLSQPTVSKHLKVLREAGLAGVREEGQHRYYHLVREPLETIEDWLIPFTSADAAADAATLAAAGGTMLNEEQLGFATALGKIAADAALRVQAAVAPIRRKASDVD
ncbi:ArsR/SmtB family transcription factor [Agromyces seonyuensis]|uniref:Metalloregulator ArsR/SmtB family transcription factor n=1 Tax=Agromyces seonyuensis TaxID=2662446 RepID=A0A6I4NVC9_9MICO|nr:metalloregulator ArsR/SmtB family transcription factor [Agromyces seonyuensis]MWB98061.1 metalloregulator ArsR/SmtB family transcription factor [Agromyces seonyuensis]